MTGERRRDSYQSQDRSDDPTRSMPTAIWLLDRSRRSLGRRDHLWIGAVERREI